MAGQERNLVRKSSQSGLAIGLECVLPKVQKHGADPQEQAMNYQQLGLLNEARLQYIAAEQHYLRALELLTSAQASHSMLWASTARNLSLLYSKTERVSLARWYARRALGVCQDHNQRHPEVIKTMAFYGALLFQLKHYHSAARYLRRAYLNGKLAGEGSQQFTADITDLLADAYRKCGSLARSAACEAISRRLRQNNAAAY